MKSKEQFILMYQDFEILSFEIDFEHYAVKIIEKLSHFDKAPHGVINAEDDKEKGIALLRFFNRRSIPDTRTGYEEIIKATGFKSGLELSFHGHGLSLSNHYWYKKEGENLSYKDINFFTNKWDDSFGKAILRNDYEALKHCDLNVPDITATGWGAKAWILEDEGPKLYKLGINDGHYEEALGEVLASRIARRLFSEDIVLRYDLKKVGDRYASVCPLMINVDEDLIPLSEYLKGTTYFLYRNKNVNKDRAKDFYQAIEQSDIPGLLEFFIKIACLKDLCFVSDLHFDNISLIKNNKTGEIRIAPIYDLGGAFGSSRTAQSMLVNPNKATYIIIYFLFSDLEPSWDYSWYNPDTLIDFEDEVRKTLSLSKFYTEDLIDRIIEVYHHQKSVLDEMAGLISK